MKLTTFLVLFSFVNAFAGNSFTQSESATNEATNSVSNSSQQQITVSGKVNDTNGQTLPGVAVLVLGTAQGTVTDVNGNYSLPNVPATATLQFSFVGMKAQEIAVAGKTVINVMMEEESIGLEEVIAIGYGTQKRKDVTSAIAVVSAEEMAKAPVANITNALQGLAPGVEVQSNQGRPGETPSIRIRGTASISSATEPLFVIDGIPQDDAYVNPSDVESMQVLKDAASTAIYGSRGANGVILITTKSGKSGAPKVRYSGYYGVEKAWKQLELLNTAQWAQVVYEGNLAGGATPPPLALQIVNAGGKYTGTETDWQSEIFQTGAISEHNVDISGGTQSGNYFFSAGQYKQEGIIIDTPYKRYSMRMNSNWHTDKFKFGENISFIYSQSEAEDANGGRATIEEMIKITPNIAVRNPDKQGGFSGYDASLVGHDASNPVGSLLRATNMNYNKRFMANVYGEYEIINDLALRSTFGINSVEGQNRNFVLKTDMTPKNYANTTLSESSTWTYNWVWENMLTYHKVVGDHDVTAMGAYTSEYYKMHNMNATGSIIQTETNDVLSLVESGKNVGGGESEGSRISYLGRVMYSYMGKYMLTVNMRRDGSSKFGPGNKWGNFPSASVAWRISDESFMNSFENISNLKLRTSYGVVGNDGPIGAYSYVSGLTSGQDYVFNNAKYSGVTLTGFNNPSIQWETVKQFDLGLDIGLFKGAFEATVDYYKKNTEDMLVSVPLPGSSGSSGSINQNVGSILNRGFEFSTTYRKSKGDLNYSISANLATNYNEVLDMYGVVINSGGVEFGSSTRTEVGHSIGEFYGYKALGVFPDQASIDAYVKDGTKIQPNAKPGDMKWKDVDLDGKINSNDREYIGSPMPDFTYGINANLEYKGFDLSLFFQGVQGNDVYAELVAWTEGMHNNFNLGTAALDRWQKPGDITDVPRAVRNDPNGNISKVSSRYIKDGSYLRLKNLSLGYTVPKAWANYMKISNLRVYLTGRNLITFTKYPFYDPEIGSGAIGTGGQNVARGIDNGYYPQARTLIMGIQLDL